MKVWAVIEEATIRKCLDFVTDIILGKYTNGTNDELFIDF